MIDEKRIDFMSAEKTDCELLNLIKELVIEVNWLQSRVEKLEGKKEEWEDETENPYLLHGEELERLELMDRRGAR